MDVPSVPQVDISAAPGSGVVMDVPSVPKLEYGNISAAPGWDGNLSLDFPPFPDDSTTTRSGQPGSGFESMERAAERLESQRSYVFRRTGRGHQFLDPNLPPWGTYPTLPEPFALHYLETHQEVLVDSSRTDDSRTWPFSDVRGPSIIPNLYASQWNPWQGPDILSNLLSDRRNENLVIPSTSAAGPSSIPHQPDQPINIGEWPSKEYELSTPSQMKLEVHLVRPSHYVSNSVRFTILVENVPKELNFRTSMLEGVAKGPNGIQYPCSIRKCKPSMSNSYFGSVRICDAPGTYELNVRLTLPIRRWSNMKPDDRGSIDKTIYLPVSKNYVLDSRDCSSRQLPFQPVAPFTSCTGQTTWSKVWGLTCDTRRNHIYYSDRASHLIRCVDPEGRLIYNIGPTTHSGDLNRPAGLAFDHNNNRLIVVDKDNHRICFFTPDGRYITSFGIKGHFNGQFNYPWGVSVNPRNQDIAVMDSRNKRIQLFDRNCNYIQKFSIFETDPFNYKQELDNPRGCSFDTEGNFLYVTDYGVQNLWKLTSDLSSGKKIVENLGLHRPQGVVVDKYDNVLVADQNNHCVRILTSEGQNMGSVRGVSNRFMENPINLTFLAGEEKLVLMDSNAKLHIF